MEFSVVVAENSPPERVILFSSSWTAQTLVTESEDRCLSYGQRKTVFSLSHGEPIDDVSRIYLVPFLSILPPEELDELKMTQSLFRERNEDMQLSKNFQG